MNPIGIMQGRLSLPVPGRLQAFPWRTWEHEFDRARACGFDALEWLVEAEGYRDNPIWTDAGVAQIRRASGRTGVQVRTLCADFFMVRPFVRVTPQARAASVDVLRRLIRQAQQAGIDTILIPILETAELRTPTETREFLDAIRPALQDARRRGVRVGLESELPAAAARDLMTAAAVDGAGIYYDTGNATARGYDAAEDLGLLGPWLCGVHVKDRRRNGPSVPLGEGETDFPAVFRALVEVGYEGPVIVQSAMGPGYLELAARYAAFVRSRLQAAWAAAAETPAG